jgi:hypothetical protein
VGRQATSKVVLAAAIDNTAPHASQNDTAKADQELAVAVSMGRTTRTACSSLTIDRCLDEIEVGVVASIH